MLEKEREYYLAENIKQTIHKTKKTHKIKHIEDKKSILIAHISQGWKIYMYINAVVFIRIIIVIL